MNEKLKNCKSPVGASFAGIPVRHDTTVPLKKERGITLVALVITIIILLILAGVTLNLALNGGLIEKSQVASDKYSEEQAREKLQLAILEYKMKLITNEYGEEISLNDHLSTIEGITVDQNTNKINIGRHQFTVNPDTWEITGGNKGETQVTPQEPVNPESPQEPEEPIVGKDNTEGTTHTKIGSGDYAYNNPVIPAGFKTIETTGASWKDLNNDGIVDGWNDGLVIQDSSGNQFVWVPVDGTNVTFTKWLAGSYNYEDDGNAMPITTAQETTMISTYKGFYIARYEAGKPSSGTVPLSKQGQTVWTSITYNNSYAYAKTMCNKDNVKSGLLTGRMWDATMKWLQNAGVDIQENSGSWGNFTISTSPANVSGFGEKQVAGYSDYWQKKNIYDIAGNVSEWTAEKSLNGSGRTKRGGRYNVAAKNRPPADRWFEKPTESFVYVGFRVALYMI